MGGRPSTNIARQARAPGWFTSALAVCICVRRTFAIIDVGIAQQLRFGATQCRRLSGASMPAGWLTRISFGDMAATASGLGIVRTFFRA